MKDATESETDEPVWLPLFPATRGYVYTRLPPATTVGHRAESWDVEKPFAEVSVRVLAADEAARVLLEDDTGALFAECPVPADRPLISVSCPGSPHCSWPAAAGRLTLLELAPLQVVEPVIDSSRYYVLRVEDGASGRHAFLGLGFGTRGEASDFNAALSEHRAFIQRKRQAEETRREWEEAAAGGGDAAAGQGGGGQVATGGMASPPIGSALHASLARSGEPLKLRLALPLAASPDGERRPGFVSSRLVAESTAGGESGPLRGDGSSDGQRRLPMLRPPPGKLTPPAAASGGALLPAEAGSTPGDDATEGDWGDFVG